MWHYFQIAWNTWFSVEILEVISFNDRDKILNKIGKWPKWCVCACECTNAPLCVECFSFNFHIKSMQQNENALIFVDIFYHHFALVADFVVCRIVFIGKPQLISTRSIESILLIWLVKEAGRRVVFMRNRHIYSLRLQSAFMCLQCRF